MRIQLSKFALAAGFGLALALSFSCSSDDGGGGNAPSSPSEALSSSLSAFASSSSDAVFSSSSVAVSSSSEVILSSSSVAVSSSSEVVFSSSSAEVSSSSEVVFSSSSEILSSSSEIVSSSSSILSSSSSLATYTITYNAGTGVTDVSVPANQTKIHNVSLTLSTTVPTRTGYEFAGWNTASNGSGTSYAMGTSYTANVGVTLFAQWTCSLNGGTVKIGEQVWMKENLNCDVNGSKCYGEDGKVAVIEGSGVFTTLSNSEIQANCAKYGRLYDWATAMNLPDSCNTSSCLSYDDAENSRHQGICPSGWHIPSSSEWHELFSYTQFDKGYYEAKYLKATSGWNESSNGLDSYGFSALPGGLGGLSNSDGSFFFQLGNNGYWRSTSDYSSLSSYSVHIGYNEGIEFANCYKQELYSVRCLKD